MPMDERLTRRSIFLVFMAATTFAVPGEAHRSIEGSRFPKQLITASAPSMAAAISCSADSLETSILVMPPSIASRSRSIFSLDPASSTSTWRPLSLPSSLFSTDRATGNTVQERDGSSLASAIANLPTSPMPPLVAYNTATFLAGSVMFIVCVKERKEGRNSSGGFIESDSIESMTIVVVFAFFEVFPCSYEETNGSIAGNNNRYRRQSRSVPGKNVCLCKGRAQAGHLEVPVQY
mmetsp:Transcript_108972/g.222467  ORF Transcript_108972/g.222467 Transcript_108972/m.222467 type:complete len:235 (-) Transcript_108972:27-731(-)